MRATAAIGVCGTAWVCGLAQAQPSMADLRAWFDADDASTITLDTGTSGPTVRRWANKGLEGGAVENADPTGQPAFLAAGANGHPTLRFDGINDALRDLDFSTTAFGDVTALIVFSPRANAGTWSGMLSFATATESDYIAGLNIDQGQPATTAFSYLNVEGARQRYPGGTNFRTASDAFGGFHILRVNYTRWGVSISVDGRQERGLCGNDPRPVQAHELRLGARSWTSPGSIPFERSFGAIDLSEALVYDRVFRCGELGATLAYLSSKWGVPLVDSVDCCPADVDDGTGSGNPDCGVTVDDLLYYLEIFAAGDVRADLDDGSGLGSQDGGVTIEDLLYFLVRYAQGC